MANVWTSAFSETNCSCPYFVVSGLTTDNIINDELAISDVKMMLHRHLIEQGFDAVVFYDPVRMLHFYDAKTSFIVRNTIAPTPQQLNSALSRRTTAQGQPAPAQPPQRSVFRRLRQDSAESENRNWGSVWEFNVGNTTVGQAYARLAMLLSRTDFRCAVVFPDCMALQLENDALIVQARHKALTAPLANRAVNKNIIIFMTESDPHNSISDVLLPRAQAGDLANFFASYIVPKLEEDEMRNYLRIPPPNASEICNMLNMLRLRDGMQVEIRHIREIAQRLAAYCCKKWVSMSSLFNLMQKWHTDNPGQSFGMNEASQITGAGEFKNIWQRLEAMIGLEGVKAYFYRLREMSQIQNLDEEDAPGRLWVNRFVSSMRGHGLNMALLGNPGTGKSTVANLLGELYQALRLLPTANVTVVSATELTSAEALHQRVRMAMGGVLLIDEAYALMNRISGQDVIDALVADMGTYAGQFAVVLCGYPEQTRRMLEANDGLRRRIPAQNTILMPDYTWDQLKQIFFSMAGQDSAVDVSALRQPETMAVLDNIFAGWHGEASHGWGNAGEVENLLNAIKVNCADRMSSMLRTEEQADRKLQITIQDFPEYMQNWSSSSEENLQTAYENLEKLTGLKNVKRVIFEIARTIQLSNGSIKEPGFYVFHGPPGTGKSMMAEKMGLIFQKLGVIKRRIPYVITAQKLLEAPEARRPGEMVDWRENRLQEALMLSENGILFIDEAHQLADTPEGRGLIRELVPLMETAEFRKTHCIILAGYTTEMEKLFSVDSGLNSRFPLKNRIKFKNYSASELTDILQKMAQKDGETLDEEFVSRTRVALSKYLSVPRPNFGNARFMRNEYLVAAKEKRNVRILRENLGVVSEKTILTEEQLQRLTPELRHTLTPADIPEKPENFAALAGPVGSPVEEPLTAAGMTEQLFGKKEVKSYIRQITGAAADNSKYSGGIHYTICGPLGSGKETVVRTIANVLAEQDLIDCNEVRFFSKGDLEAGFVGQTADKTRQAITEAQGGTVVLVNPSSMLTKNSHDNSFGPDVIGEFFSCIGKFGANTSFVILDSEMGMEAFMKAYPSCRSTFERHFVLDDLDVESMQHIFRQQSRDYLFTEDIAPLLDDFVANWTADRGGLGSNFLAWANGDEIEKLLSKLKNNWEVQRGETGKNERNRSCPVITKGMFPIKLHRYLKATREGKQEVLLSMDREIGLARVKKAIKAIEVKMHWTSPERVMPGHYCFIGNPGVGKTRMAEKLGNVLQATNVLKQGLVITRTAREMMEQIDKFDQIIRMARENVLFIDEAHQLADTNAGVAVIKKLLTVLEDTSIMKNICIVLAGYPREMAHLLSVDAGLYSRFEGNIIQFDDYTVDELVSLLTLFGKKAAEDDHLSSDRNYDLTTPENAPFVAQARKGLEYMLAKRNPNYGNARYVRNLLRDAITEQMLRLDKQHNAGQPITEADWMVLLPEDLPIRYRSSNREDGQSSIRCIPAHKIATTPACPILPENIDKEIARIRQSVFLLELQDENCTAIGFGTGFSITEDGYLLTCAHVVSKAVHARARLYYPGMVGGERWFDDCEILHPIFEDVDMAVVKIKNATGLVPLTLRSPDEGMSVAEDIVVCGYPFGDQLQINKDPHFVPSHFFGPLSSEQGKGTDAERVFIGCEAKQGNSGSPVISRIDGKVVGVLRGSETNEAQGGKLVEEMNFFGPIRLAWERFIESSI